MTNKLLHLDPVTVKEGLLKEMVTAVSVNLLDRWYPLVIDKTNGGYFTNITYDWKIEPEQPKMIVTQARQVWTASRAALLFDNKKYAAAAKHGFDFFRNKMWDQKFGGFYNMRSIDGGTSDYLGFFDEKRAYGNAFAIYGLAALYDLTRDDKVLDFAKEAFLWIEKHAFDPKLKGYFQFLTREGTVFDQKGVYKTKAYDDVEQGLKDQNSSIHLLEAYTELYRVWPDELLREKLIGLLMLIRDVITTERGYMNLFFEYDWTPYSIKNNPKDLEEKNFRLDHVSFGHNYETAFLMLEASYVLGLKNDVETLAVAKKMLDHALVNGWDNENGGFVDAAFYFGNDNVCTVVQPTKNWWAQAEALNVLLIMSKIFPENDIYRTYFLKQWNYIKTYILDHEYGDWFEGGLDREPHFRNGRKGHIWKAAYHTGRTLMNCIKMLSIDDAEPCFKNEGFLKEVAEFSEFIEHWKSIGEKIPV
jgi:mannobiose 2-epimerase